MKIFHFTFGSPQRFIAQARRTRDLWAGSYLLSWLCGRAMCELKEKDSGVEFLMPNVDDDPLFKQICLPDKNISLNNPAAHLGSLPTRFSARLSSEVDPGACGDACIEAVNKAWEEGAVQAVRKLFYGFGQFGGVQQNIWQCQTKRFWPCQWVVGDDPALLDRRKRVGNPLPSDEPGLKCTVCGERQELSGKWTPVDAGKWWNELREYKNEDGKKVIHDLDLRESERLCAVCLVKRLFPSVAEQAIGWPVPRFYPSTAYVAAVDWLKQMLDLAEKHQPVKQAAKALLDVVEPHPIVSREEARNWSPVRSIGEWLRSIPELWKIQAVSGSVFFEDSLRSDDLELDEKKRKEAIAALKRLQEAIDAVMEEGTERARATPFYALLKMDGDGMGELFSTHSLDEQQSLARALAVFNRRVPEIVKRHDGWLIYAAGEDVFALLPVSRALRCACEVRRAYRQALFEHASFVPGARATISAAINFAHMNIALGTVVRDTRNSLLDDVAKDEVGRDAIACRIWKRGGPILTWAQPWDIGSGEPFPETVRELFAQGSYSSRFFYKLGRFFRMHKEAGGVFDNNGLRDLLVAEYLANRELDSGSDSEAATFCVELLMALCRQWRREITPEGAAYYRPGGFRDSGALLVRFLHQKEV